MWGSISVVVSLLILLWEWRASVASGDESLSSWLGYCWHKCGGTMVYSVFLLSKNVCFIYILSMVWLYLVGRIGKIILLTWSWCPPTRCCFNITRRSIFKHDFPQLWSKAYLQNSIFPHLALTWYLNLSNIELNIFFLFCHTSHVSASLEMVIDQSRKVSCIWGLFNWSVILKQRNHTSEFRLWKGD